MSRLTLTPKNVTGYQRVTGYFFEKCHRVLEKCHGKKKHCIYQPPKMKMSPNRDLSKLNTLFEQPPSNDKKTLKKFTN